MPVPFVVELIVPASVAMVTDLAEKAGKANLESAAAVILAPDTLRESSPPVVP